jgi:NAD(P)-dependent dehydrogenase (short-subunit alcohol dehydrogenase family)
VARKTILITGGNAGIGLATALRFAKGGFNVAIVGRRDAVNQEAIAKVKASGGEAIAFAGDVTDEAFIRSAIRKTAQTFGGLHAAFNNAGVEQVPSPLPEQTITDYRKIMDTNVQGVWLCMREEIPVMLESGGGSIVNTSSVAGIVGMGQVPLYIASKHAVIGLTKAVALEYAKQGIRVNAIAPAAVKTDLYDRFTQHNAEMQQAIEEMHPMGRSGTVDEVASAVYWLCTEATWTTGQTLVTDGGFTVQ